LANGNCAPLSACAQIARVSSAMGGDRPRQPARYTALYLSAYSAMLSLVIGAGRG